MHKRVLILKCGFVLPKHNKLKRFLENLYVYWTKLEDLKNTKIKNAMKAWHE